ncbi:nitroreductase [Streptomyces sp. SM13]|uniref:nitroreductase n=1 Tax=Streptomyces sp. SM13 TaxID=1983803 RepID=UPI002156044D|nr:nitroreductase [Streptomyces sp. SM13]
MPDTPDRTAAPASGAVVAQPAAPASAARSVLPGPPAPGAGAELPDVAEACGAGAAGPVMPADVSASARAPEPVSGGDVVADARPAAPGFLRQALADARSPRVPALSPYVPERPFPWNGAGLPVAGTGVTAEGSIDLDRVLRLSLAAPTRTPGRLRPVPSAGALHPVRAHLLLGPGCSLPPGRYAYDPRTHRAHPRGPAPADLPAGALVVLTVAASRTVAHYGHRAWPLLLLDTGHAAAALALAASSALDVRVCLDADAALLSAAAGLPRAPDWQDAWPGTEPELSLGVVRLVHQSGRSADAEGALNAWAELPQATAPAPQPGADTAPPRELAAARHLLDHVARDPEQPGGTWYPAARPKPVTDDDLKARRSAPPADLNLPPGKDLLARILATAQTAHPAGPAWTAAVGGPSPSLYASTPGGHGLDVRASGDARPTLAHWAARQQWVGTAGAVLLAHGCPEDASPAAMRSSHLVAGYAVGAAQAHATALGLRSRPIGSWQQADLGAALGDTPRRDWIVHGLALGRGGPAPASSSHPASPP